MREYQNCYIAHLDLLGFKELINENPPCEKIAEIFDEVNTQYDVCLNKEKLVPENSLHYKVMSDSICIYITVDVPNALAALIHTCAFFQVRMLRLNKPILVRGAIVQGELYCKDDVLFGKGLIDAYLIQEKYANFPRIIMPLNLIDNNKSSESIVELFTINLLFKEPDQVYCIDYVRMFYALEHPKGNDKNLSEFIYTMLCKNFNKSVRDKYLYLQSRFALFYNEEEKHNV